jgi:Xaa-Pro aminopeptidase
MAFDVPATVVEVLRERGLGGGRVGLVGGNAMLASPYRRLLQTGAGIDFEPADDLVERLRMIKSPGELDLIRQAAEVGCRSVTAMMERALQPGTTEAEAIAAGLNVVAEAGMAIYDAACASGPHSNHYSYGRLPSWTTRELEAGDFFHVDTYGTLNGYLYDFSRTAVCGGKPSAGQREVLDAAVAAVDGGLAAMRPGVPARAVYEAVRGVLDERGMTGEGLGGPVSSTPALVGSFPAHGHQIGLFWEPPWLVPDEEMELQEGMAFGVELMAGRPEVGSVKLEQDVIVTGDGVELLTPIPKYFT